jgi:hypothetical protein
MKFPAFYGVPRAIYCLELVESSYSVSVRYSSMVSFLYLGLQNGVFPSDFVAEMSDGLNYCSLVQETQFCLYTVQHVELRFYHVYYLFINVN